MNWKLTIGLVVVLCGGCLYFGYQYKECPDQKVKIKTRVKADQDTIRYYEDKLKTLQERGDSLQEALKETSQHIKKDKKDVNQAVEQINNYKPDMHHDSALRILSETPIR